MNILSTLSNDELKKVKYAIYTKNEVIFLEDEICNKIGIIIDGNIQIASYSFNGKEVIFNKLSTNQMFGANLIFAISPFYKGKVIALNKCKIAFITYNDLLIIMQKNIAFLKYYLKYISTNSIDNRQKIEILSFNNAKDRLMYFLYLNHYEYKYNSITDLAKTLSLTREVLSRTIHKLKEDNILIIENKIIKMV